MSTRIIIINAVCIISGDVWPIEFNVTNSVQKCIDNLTELTSLTETFFSFKSKRFFFRFYLNEYIPTMAWSFISSVRNYTVLVSCNSEIFSVRLPWEVSYTETVYNRGYPWFALVTSLCVYRYTQSNQVCEAVRKIILLINIAFFLKKDIDSNKKYIFICIRPTYRRYDGTITFILRGVNVFPSVRMHLRETH